MTNCWTKGSLNSAGPEVAGRVPRAKETNASRTTFGALIEKRNCYGQH